MRRLLSIFIILAILLSSMPTEALHAKEYASFSSFYKESSSWKKWAIAGGTAVATGVIVFFTGGTASPLVAPFVSTIGGWLGAAGLSGAAATSSGLAMLGGGSLASGGFGMAGGAALLTTAITGATEAGGLGIEAYMRKRAYDNLAEELKNAPNFPPFVNDSGPECIKNAKEVLDKNYDAKMPPSSDGNLKALKDAICELDKYHEPKERIWSLNYKENIRRERLRIYALKSLLYFMMGENVAAYKAANDANDIYKIDDGNKDAVLFISAISGLITKSITLNVSQALVTNAIASDQESPIMPLLFSIYLSRVSALDMITPEFITSFSLNLDHLPEETAGPCWAIVGMTILSQLKVYHDNILIWKENEHLLSEKNIDNALNFCENTYKSFEELITFSKKFGIRMPVGKSDDTKDSFKIAFNKSISDYADNIEKLQDAISELNELRVKFNRESDKENAKIQSL